MAEETATFSLKVDADAEPAAEAADQLEKFRATIVKSQAALADYRKSQSLLRGSSDEVKDAKAKLKAAIDLEKGKVSQANLGILRLGGSYDKLAKAQKKNTDQTSHGRAAISAIGGPVKGLLDKFDGLKSALPALASGWGLLAAGVAVAVLSFAMAAVSLGSLTLKFTEWLATTADANRDLRLTREAFSGNARNADGWGRAIARAGESVAQTTEQLNGLVVATESSLRGTRISGDGMKALFHATAEAAGAGRDDTVKALQDIIDRGKLTGRTFLKFDARGISELATKGIDATEVFKALGLTGQQALRGAVVTTDQMAKALDKVATSRFADINAKKALSLGFQWKRIQDNLMHFTDDLAGSGGAFEPLLGAIKQVADLFDQSTESGRELKASITQYGQAISSAVVAHLPDITAFVAKAIELAPVLLSAGTAAVEFGSSIVGVFADSLGGADGLRDKLEFVRHNFEEATAAIDGVRGAVVWLENTFGHLATSVREFFNNTDFVSVGTAIVDGIKSGLLAAWDGLKNVVTTMGQGIKDTFKSLLGIHSPSTEFALYGRQSDAGYAQGITRGQPVVKAAVASMAAGAVAEVATNPVAVQPTPRAPASSTDGGGGKRLQIGTIENHFHISGKGGEEIRQTLSSRSFLEGFESSFKILLQSQGIPTGTGSVSGG